MPRIPISVVMVSESQVNRGMMLATTASSQLGRAKNPAKMYAKSAAVSHLRYRETVAQLA